MGKTLPSTECLSAGVFHMPETLFKERGFISMVYSSSAPILPYCENLKVIF
eukprot:Gb_37756 [translate_table: standard]